MEAGEKICPRCAESVKAAAIVCKHCGHEFGAPAMASVVKAEPEKKNRPFRTGCLTIIGIFIVLAVIGAVVGPQKNSSNGASSDAVSSGDAVAPLAVTATQLAAAYDANEVSAQQAFGGQTLDVTGTVSGVTLDMFNNPVVQLAGVNQFLPVQASFDDDYKEKLSALSKGQRITIRCTKITEVISAPMLDDCTIP